jgi:hypothetical protein
MFLRCKVSPGQFSNEMAVGGRRANGEEFSLFAPRDKVWVRPLASEAGAPQEGLLEVVPIEREGKRVLIRLPGQALESAGSGTYETVKAADLEPSDATPGRGAR